MKQILLGAILAAMVSCGGQSGPESDGVFFPVVPDSGAGPSAEINTTLVQDSGCLFAEIGGARELILWPDGTSFSDGAVKNDNGDVIVEVGGSFRAGGGEIEQGAANELVGTIPSECQTDTYLLVAEFL
jgi:hypothetical protein